MTLATWHASQDSKIAKVALKFLKKLFETSGTPCHVDRRGIILLQGGSLANVSKCLNCLFVYNVLVILIYSSLNFVFPIVGIA